jgi:drug/metabolite transporter (DMT)-like permease
MFTFATMDGVQKFLVHDYTIAQLFFIRYIVFICFALWICRKTGARAALRSKRPFLQIARAIILLLEGFAFLASFRYLGLADVHAIVAGTPLIVTVLAATVLAEHVGIHRWLAVLVGFVGALIIIRPGLGMTSWHVLLPIGAALTYAIIQIQARLLGAHDRGETTILYTALVGLAIMAVAGPFFWVWPRGDVLLRDGGLMVLVGLLGATAHYLLIISYRHAQASVLQPYTYFLVAWATMVGFLMFGETPDFWTIVGAVIIVASGLYTFRRERKILNS